MDLIETYKRGKIKRNWDPTVTIPKFRGQNENATVAETMPLILGIAVFVFSIPIQQAENLQRILSNRGSRLSPTISFVEDNSPAKAGLVRGWVSIKGEKAHQRGGGKSQKETERLNPENQSQEQKKTNPKDRATHRTENQSN